MLRPICVVLLAAMVVLSGCQASTKPRTISDGVSDEKLKVRKAPFNGQYELFEARKDANGERKLVGEPLATERLRRGDRLGFRRADGQLQAVAGDRSIPLTGDRYAWQMRADKGQVDGSRTVALVVLIVAVTALAGQVAFASGFSW